ncbi:MAG: hypothetical protein AB8H12_04400 [Lewinella sp.]
MKHLFAAILFWMLGYVIPSFPVFLQYAIATVVVLFLSTALFYLVDTRVYARMLHEQGEGDIPDHLL